MKLVTPKAGAKHDILFDKPASKHLNQVYVAQQSVSKFTTMTNKNLVKSKAQAKLDLLLNKPKYEADLLHKSSNWAAALGVTKFITTIYKKRLIVEDQFTKHMNITAKKF